MVWCWVGSGFFGLKSSFFLPFSRLLADFVGRIVRGSGHFIPIIFCRPAQFQSDWVILALFGLLVSGSTRIVVKFPHSSSPPPFRKEKTSNIDAVFLTQNRRNRVSVCWSALQFWPSWLPPPGRRAGVGFSEILSTPRKSLGLTLRRTPKKRDWKDKNCREDWHQNQKTMHALIVNGYSHLLPIIQG